MKFKNDIEKFEFFELFLKNEITYDERIKFEAALKNDRQLAIEFGEYRDLSGLVVDGSILTIKDDLSVIHKKNNGDTNSFPGKRTGLSNTNLTLFFIAGVVLISGILLIVNSKQENIIPDEIGANTQKSEAVVPTGKTEKVIGAGSEENTREKAKKEIKTENATIIENETSLSQMANDDLQRETDEMQDSATVSKDKNIKQNETVPNVLPPVKIPDNNLAKNKTEREDVPEQDGLVDCGNTEIHCDYKIVHTCIEDVSGEIIVDKKSLVGGNPPYTISIDGGDFYYESRFAFRSLNAGIYNLFVKDKNLCEKEIARIEIEEKICNTDYKYSPVFGELWTIPAEKNKTGVFRLFNKSGQILVEKEIDLYSDKTWDGKDDNGSPLRMDYYPFIIQYEDGEIFKGSVTLFK